MLPKATQLKRGADGPQIHASLSPSIEPYATSDFNSHTCASDASKNTDNLWTSDVGFLQVSD